MATYLFVDGENFLHKLKDALIQQGVKKQNIDCTRVDLKKLIQLALPNENIEQSTFYAAKLHMHEDSRTKSLKLIQQQRVLKTNLEKQGFTFVLAGNVRPQKVTVDGRSKTIFREKGVDVRLAVDLVSLSCDKIIKRAIICSSDSDLQPAIAEARKRGVEVVYLGFEMSPNKGLTFTTNRTVLFRNSEIVQVVPTLS